MKFYGIKQTLLLVLTAFTLVGSAQKSRFIQYGATHGLEDPFIYDLGQNTQGYLFVATGNGLAVFNGQKFHMHTVQNGTSEVISALNTNQKKVWLGYLDGSIGYYAKGRINIVFKDTSHTSKIVDIDVDNNGIWALAQDGGLFYIENNRLKSFHQLKKASNYSSIIKINSKELLVGTSEGLIELKLSENNHSIQEPEEFVIEEESITDIDAYQEGLVITSMERMYYRTPSGSYQAVDVDGIEENPPKQTYITSNDDVLLATYSGMQHYINSDKEGLLLKNSYNELSGLPTNNINSVFEDIEGNLWVGTYGNGLFKLIDEFFSFYSLNLAEQASVSAFAIKDSLAFIGVNKRFAIYKKDLSTEISWTTTRDLPQDNIVCIAINNLNDIWIAYENNGIYNGGINTQFNKIKLSESRLSDFTYDVVAFKDKMAIATENGVFLVDNQKNVTDHYSTINGLRHNKIYALSVEEDNLYVGARGSSISVLSDDGPKEIPLLLEGSVLDIISLLKVEDHLFVGTAASGLMDIYEGKMTRYSTEKGMLSNNCKSISLDSRGNIWVGHGNGLSRINVKDSTVKRFGEEHKIIGDVASNAMIIDGDDLWIGMSDGLMKYDASQETNQEIIPFVNLERILVNGKPYPLDEDIDLSYGTYKLQFFFNAISFNRRDDIKFQCKLKGYDDDWHNIKSQSPEITYNKLPSGKYQFQLRACLDAKCNTVLHKHVIKLDAPFWYKWWFYVLVVILVVTIIFLFVWFRTRNLRKIQAYLERNLEEKTREVVQKNNLLEERNKDIVDSIDYAKHIQDAILPDTEILKSNFSEHFIMFKPRDIVSGDFYWIHDSPEYFLVVCADCTGHGVPGALMSMIGSLSISKCVTSGKTQSPSEVLQLLDIEVRSLLQKEASDDGVKDGMDLTFAAFEKSNKTLKVASAKRNYFVRIDGELILCKGDRSSIGGDNNIKEFYDKEFQLSEGDYFYFFTDGYPDQIGGPRGRKIMTSGVKKLIEQVGTQDLSSQKMFFENYFNEWKANEMQLDDVLMMAFKV